MIFLVFSAIGCLFLLQSLYFCWRFALHRLVHRVWNLPSLICAMYPVGWVLVVARELHMLPRIATTPLLAAALTFGMLTLLIILNHERQQSRPFR